MNLFRETTILVLFLSLLVGCSKESAEKKSDPGKSPDVNKAKTPAKVEVSKEELKLAEALTAAGAKLKTDKDSFVIEVDFRNANIDDSALQGIEGLSRLRSLLLNKTKITDAALEPVGKIQTLENLDLRDCSLNNKALSHLTGLSKLKALRLSGNSDIDDDAMADVNKLTNLKALMLDFLWVSGDGLTQLKDLNKLEELYLAKTLVDDEGLVALSQFPKLKKTRLSQNQISDAGLEALTKIPNLIELDLSENSLLSDTGMQHLAGLNSLQKLNLWRVGLTDEGVGHLKGLTNLKWLNLDNTRLGNASLKSLKDMQQLEFLHLGSTAITDAGLVELEGLTSLKDLKLTRTAITEKRVAELQKKLPNTEIQLKYIAGQ
ncbi:MAG: hypothetical protein QM501_15075 [Gimesia sp.]